MEKELEPGAPENIFQCSPARRDNCSSGINRNKSGTQIFCFSSNFIPFDFGCKDRHLS
jgi:hypothetical protein